MLLTGWIGTSNLVRTCTRATRAALLDGAPGAVFLLGGRLRGALEFVVSGGRITAVDVVFDPLVLDALDVVLLED